MPDPPSRVYFRLFLLATCFALTGSVASLTVAAGSKEKKSVYKSCVRSETLEVHGAVSEEVAREMAEGARKAAEADLAVAISGIAGPGGSEHKPEGRVCFALANSTETITETKDFGALGRGNVRAAATHHALELLRSALSDD